ncbi:MAG: deoxyribose-phosphate aldolase [Candidatus Thermoplasmatota archaeon]|nr:deoxyribose-phosphate aldolase [Candidatus Thermoplasmatota archaeon]MBU4070923.1 deoxyribose-phosphate aldolase [Candidatus Thermoplasmatota archaeon]MBU4144308.1 deoxyribose-phosphate aldolase [Candidatus Thermoplasmatota archaeon]MBU4592601.1 deoxyribose-phosphate aldolase [Candidatus Thermoplasmatota archaeon]
MTREKLAGCIDHTLLKADAKRGDIEKLCSEAMEYGFASVCVNPSWVPVCRKHLEGSKVKVCTVIGFPLGSTSSESKTAEAKIAVRQGADELDMVMNVGRLLDGDDDYVRKDIEAVVKAAQRRIVKVIIEICYLDNNQIIKACQLSKEAGADFVKTSTGFGTGGATVEAIALMRETVGTGTGVKASGGIRNREDAIKMLAAGASRIGASAGIAIVEGG